MRSDEILDELIELNVLEPSETGSSFSVSPEFLDRVDATRTALEGDDAVGDYLSERFDDPTVVESLASVGEDDPVFVANYCALADRAEALSHDDLVRTVAVLTQIRESVPRSEGAPDPFFPVRGDQLSTLLQFSPRSIVYVWREDCEPCDLMRETFEELFPDPPEDVALFAVYGPDYAEHLYERFDVVGAPTTLFTIGDRVDSRLQGAHYAQAVEGELATIRELTQAS